MLSRERLQRSRLRLPLRVGTARTPAPQPSPTPMRLVHLPFAALACLGAAALAQDPLKSPACERAIAALQSARSGNDAATTESARRQATLACLGGSGEPLR